MRRMAPARRRGPRRRRALPRSRPAGGVRAWRRPRPGDPATPSRPAPHGGPPAAGRKDRRRSSAAKLPFPPRAWRAKADRSAWAQPATAERAREAPPPAGRRSPKPRTAEPRRRSGPWKKRSGWASAASEKFRPGGSTRCPRHPLRQTHSCVRRAAPGSRPDRRGSTAIRRHRGPRRRRISRSTRRCRE